LPTGKEAPKQIPHYARPLSDSDIRRSLWWDAGALPERIKRAVDRPPGSRQAWLWCGAGAACTYARGVETGVLLKLYEFSGIYWCDFLSGFPFSAEMRREGGDPFLRTEPSCFVLLNKASKEAENLAVHTLDAARTEEISAKDTMEQLYACVRQRLVDRIQKEAQNAGQKAVSGEEQSIFLVPPSQELRKIKSRFTKSRKRYQKNANSEDRICRWRAAVAASEQRWFSRHLG